MIDVSAAQLKTIRQILVQYVPHTTVWAFGSRVLGTAQPYSDLDLAIVGTEKIPRATLTQLKEAFVASDIPFRVDILDWHRVSPSFQQIIAAQFVPLLVSDEIDTNEVV